MVLYRDSVTNEVLLSSKYDFKLVQGIIYKGKCNGLVEEIKLKEITITEEEFGIEIFKHIRRIQQHLWENDCSLEESDEFMDKTLRYMNQIQKIFQNWQIYKGESKSPQGMIVLVNDDDEFVMLKDGLYEDDEEDDEDDEEE